jgi:hypothetical protein
VRKETQLRDMRARLDAAGADAGALQRARDEFAVLDETHKRLRAEMERKDAALRAARLRLDALAQVRRLGAMDERAVADAACSSRKRSARTSSARCSVPTSWPSAFVAGLAVSVG